MTKDSEMEAFAQGLHGNRLILYGLSRFDVKCTHPKPHTRRYEKVAGLGWVCSDTPDKIWDEDSVKLAWYMADVGKDLLSEVRTKVGKKAIGRA